MHGELFGPFGADRADAGVVPYIGAIAPGVTQAEAVGVLGAALLEHEDEFVLRAIERAIPPLDLFQTTRFLNSVKLASPAASNSPMCRQSIHTNAIAPSRITRAMFQSFGEEGGELVAAHLSARKGELAMLDRAQATHIAVDRNIIGRMGKHQVGAFAIEQPVHRGSITRVAAEQALVP